MSVLLLSFVLSLVVAQTETVAPQGQRYDEVCNIAYSLTCFVFAYRFCFVFCFLFVFFLFFVHSCFCQALLLSRLAYAPARFPKAKDAVEAAQMGLKDSLFQTQRAMLRGKSLGLDDEAIREARIMNGMDRNLQVVDATRDAVAYVKQDPNTQEKQLLIAYRGTAKFR
jgi:hypothetical protein